MLALGAQDAFAPCVRFYFSFPFAFLQVPCETPRTLDCISVQSVPGAISKKDLKQA
jgi:hypothetical protein